MPLELIVNTAVDGGVRSEWVGDYRDALRHDPCSYCGRRGKPMFLDHIVPAARGGPGTWPNQTAACLRCNSCKGAHSLLAFLELMPAFDLGGLARQRS